MYYHFRKKERGKTPWGCFKYSLGNMQAYMWRLMTPFFIIGNQMTKTLLSYLGKINLPSNSFLNFRFLVITPHKKKLNVHPPIIIWHYSLPATLHSFTLSVFPLFIQSICNHACGLKYNTLLFFLFRADFPPLQMKGAALLGRNVKTV